MTFVFVSHAQGDKLRPDGRMRQLVQFLFSAGIPIWVDRPEELGLSSQSLKTRCVAVDGRWTTDIREALNQCATAIGIWSVHAASRIEEDPAGVLFQELSLLAVSNRLHLINLDPGVPEKLGSTFTHLSGHQQCVDLSTGTQSLLRERVLSVMNSLANRTKDITRRSRSRFRLHQRALEDRTEDTAPS